MPDERLVPEPGLQVEPAQAPQSDWGRREEEEPVDWVLPVERVRAQAAAMTEAEKKILFGQTAAVVR